jgi:nicotinate dehydrogenase subunit A
LTFYGLPVSTTIGVTTLEGLGTADNPHPLQSAFLDQQAGQCAYCSNAMMMGAYAWLTGRVSGGNTAVPTVSEVEDFLTNEVYVDPISGEVSPSPYLCRCGAHPRFVSAIQEAAKGMAQNAG